MFDSIREEVETKFKTDWTAANPGVPIQYEGVDFPVISGEKNAPKTFVSITIVPGAGQRSTIGISQVREDHLGIIIIAVFTPKNGGTKPANDLLDSAATIFRDYRKVLSTGTLHFLTPTYRNVGARDNYYQRNLLVPYNMDAKF